MPASERKQLTLLIKPASGLCNLRCQYCFYRATVERLLEEVFHTITPRGNVTFLFQGG